MSDEQPLSGGLPVHLELQGRLGAGGFGEVHRVKDLRLNREVALKVLVPPRRADTVAVQRFIEEAQITAQLDHPGIVPLYEFGKLTNGDVFYTMKIVEGTTLEERLRRDRTEERDVELRRDVETVRRAAAAVGYAHSRAVVHRDLKPSNIMIGAHDEVLVMDWGLAKTAGAPADSLLSLATIRGPAGAQQPLTVAGHSPGTPGYMAPEQALPGAEIGVSSDVYSLGVTLFSVLTGVVPTRHAALEQVVHAATVERLDESEQAELASIVRRAMAWDPKQRFPNAAALADALQRWLDGAHREAEARRLIDEARHTMKVAASRRLSAAAAAAHAVDELEALPTWAPASDRLDAWRAQDEAEALHRESVRNEVRAEQLLHRALQQHPASADAHGLLAELHVRRAEEAEDRGDTSSAAIAEAQVREHDRGAFSRWLDGDGELSLVTEPAGATATLRALVEHDRRLVPGEPQPLGITPLQRVPLARGSYLIELSLEGYDVVRYPVHIRRCEHWDGVPPGEKHPRPVPLPPLGLLGENDCYVPPGWAFVGYPEGIMNPLPPGRRWLDGFVIQRTPVSNQAFIEFLDDLVDQGRERDALDCAPRERGGNEEVDTAVIYARDANGHFHTAVDADGDRWDDRWPVIMLSWEAAQRYGHWLAERTGKPWRLAWELEWEKAARGVDGRECPWGDRAEGVFCRERGSHQDLEMFADPLDDPFDESVYGVLGLAGNARDFCLDPWRLAGYHPDHLYAETPLPPADEYKRVARGGSLFRMYNGRVKHRAAVYKDGRMGDTSFRLAYSWPG